MNNHFPDIESLAADLQFIDWVRAGKPEGGATKWKAWAGEDAIRSVWLTEAAWLVEELQFSTVDPDATAIDAEWKKLLAAINVPSVTEAAIRPLPSKKSRRSPLIAIAASLLLLAAAGLGWLFLAGADFETDFAERKTVQLKDGTEVTLRANSRLDYGKWTDGQRQVTLSGQAFFEVAHDANRPFTVMANGLSITVLGTSFNVDNRDGQQTVALETGKIKLGCTIQPENTPAQFLAPGDVAICAADGTIKLLPRPEDLATYTSWRTGFWTLEQTSLAEISRRLATDFGVSVTFTDPATPERTISGSLPSDQLDELVIALDALLDIKVTITEGDVLFD